MSFFFIIHIVVCILLVAVILFQDGKAGGLTSVSDSGQSMFGAKGAASFLTKLTSGLAIAFMCTSLFLNFTGKGADKSIASDFVPTTEVSTPDDTSVTAEETGSADETAGDSAAAENGDTPAAEGQPADASDAPAKTEENDGEDQ